MAVNINYKEVSNTYREYIDSVIYGIGKNCRLFYPRVTSSVDNSSYDPLRPTQNKYPDWESQETLEPERTEDILCLVHYSPKKFKDNGENVLDSLNIVEIKTFVENLPKINQAEYMVPNWDFKSLNYAKYKLARPPIPHGMGTPRYVISYWERT